MNYEFRPASPADGRMIAELIDMSSEGVAVIDWAEEAKHTPGTTALDIGARCYSDGRGNYSFRNCVMAVAGGEVAGVLLTFAIPPPGPHCKPVAPPFNGDDVYAPYKYLEAPDTWYVCGVAVYARYRGMGIGTGMMDMARLQGLERGYDRISLVAFENNRDAVRLYRRLGYRVIDRAPIVPHPLIRQTGDALLMVASTRR